MSFIESLAIVLGLLVAVITITVPFIKAIASMTRLTVSIETLTKSFDQHKETNDKEIDKIWEHEDIQDKLLNDHEQRISRVELRG